MANETTKQIPLNEGDLKKIYGGAGEIASNYLATQVKNTKTQGF